jgi:hypothetical protein
MTVKTYSPDVGRQTIWTIRLSPEAINCTGWYAPLHAIKKSVKGLLRLGREGASKQSPSTALLLDGLAEG